MWSIAGTEKVAQLFEEAPQTKGSSKATNEGKLRIEEPQRRQGKIRFEYPEDTLALSHPARVIWNVLG